MQVAGRMAMREWAGFSNHEFHEWARMKSQGPERSGIKAVRRVVWDREANQSPGPDSTCWFLFRTERNNSRPDSVVMMTCWEDWRGCGFDGTCGSPFGRFRYAPSAEWPESLVCRTFTEAMLHQQYRRDHYPPLTTPARSRTWIWKLDNFLLPALSRSQAPG